MGDNHVLQTPCRVFLAGLALQLTMVQAQPLTYLVGGDTEVCDFDTIQAAINAAQAHPGPDSIRVANDLSYSGLALEVGAQDLSIEGGYATCADALIAIDPPAARTILSGLGAPADSVIEFTGFGARTLRGFTIRNGDDPLSGGGIQFDGTGQLLLERVGIANNRAAHGAGINFHGAGGGPGELIVGEDVVVQGNLATESGGGVRVTGFAQLLMHSRDSAVIDNEAQGLSSSQQGHGGGVLIIGPAQARIGSPGLVGTSATIARNIARYGGGLAAIAPDDSTTVFLYNAFPDAALRIENNRASAEGGGIYLGGDFGSSTVANLRADDIRIENNRAPLGAAVSLQEMAFLGVNAWRDGSMPRPAAAAFCSAGVSCRRVAGNRSEHADGTPTDGPVLFISREGPGSSIATLERVTLQGNRGGTLIDGVFDVGRCLIVGNTTSQALAHLKGTTQVDSCTVADNQIAAENLFSLGFGASLAMSRSIVDQPGTRIDAFQSDFDNLLVRSCTLIDCNAYPNVIAAADGPRFIDPEAGDYRLHPTSPAVDFAPPVPGDDRDLDDQPYDRDLAGIANRFGERDLGAYERQTIGNLLRNSEFETDVRFWAPGTTATLMHDLTGGDTPGSLRIADAGNLTANEVVARQCVPVPGPGRYQIYGMGHGEGFLAVSRDRVSIRWRFHLFSPSGDCSGVPVLAGEMLFPNFAGFGEPLDLRDGEFSLLETTQHSHVEIELVVTEGSNGVSDVTAGYFDGVKLFLEGPPAQLFANGFEIGS